MPEYIIDQDGNPAGTLANYAFTKSAFPLDPRDTSGQIPAFSATMTDSPLNTRALVGQPLTLHDWTGEDVAATVTQVQSAGRHVRRLRNPLNSNPLENRHTGMVSVNANTLFDRLNGTLTTFPMFSAGTLPQHVLTHWCMAAGVTPLRVPDALLHYVDGSDPLNIYGFAQDALMPWQLASSGMGPNDTLDFTNPYNGSTPALPFPRLPFNPSDSLILCTYLKLASTQATAQISGTLYDATYSAIAFAITRNGSAWTVTEGCALRGSNTSSIPMNETLLSATYTPAGTSDLFVSLLIQADPNNAGNIIPTLRILETANGVTTYHDFAGASVASCMRGRPALYDIQLSGNNGSNPRPQMFSISSSSTLPTVFPVQQIQFNGTVTGTSPLTGAIGFTDNLWNRMREFCSVYEIEYDFVGGSIVFKDRAKVTTDSNGVFIPAHILHTTEPTANTQQNARARRVEVEWSKITRTANDTATSKLLWKSTSVINVAQGETHTETVKADASFSFLAQPVPVTGEPVPYNLGYGTYTVWGNDGYVVDPQWWIDNGGYVRVTPTGKSGEFTLTVQAPNVTTTRAPYKISEGENNPALYVFGNGVSYTPTKMQNFTGDAAAAQDIGTTLSAPYIVDELAARNACFKLAQAYSGPFSQISFTVPREDLRITMNANGTPAAPGTYETISLGDNIGWDGAYFRVLDLSVGPAGYNVTKAEMNNTIAVINGEFVSGGSVSFWNSFYGSTPISEVKMTPIPADYTPTPPLYPSPTLYPSETLYPSGG